MISWEKDNGLFKITLNTPRGLRLYAYSTKLSDGMYQLRYMLSGVCTGMALVDCLAPKHAKADLDAAEFEVMTQWQAALAAERAA